MELKNTASYELNTADLEYVINYLELFNILFILTDTNILTVEQSKNNIVYLSECFSAVGIENIKEIKPSDNNIELLENKKFINFSG